MPENIGNTNQNTDTNNTQNTNTQQAAGATPPSFDEWLAGADEPVKALINTRFTALENTVKATREERDAITKQLKEILPKAEKGSETEKALNDALGKLEAATKRANFLAEAVKPEIQCKNPAAAYAIALAEDLFTKSGSTDWQRLKASAPELFGIVIPPSDGGNGTGSHLQDKDMNTAIRRMAGRG